MWFIPRQILFFYWILFDKTFFKVIYFFTVCCPWHCAYNILILCAIFVSFYVYILFKRQYFIKKINSCPSFLSFLLIHTYICICGEGGTLINRYQIILLISQLKRKICAKIFLNHPPSTLFFKVMIILFPLGKKLASSLGFNVKLISACVQDL